MLLQTSYLVVFYVKFQLQSFFVILQLLYLQGTLFSSIDILALLMTLIAVLANLGVFPSHFEFQGLVPLMQTHDLLLHLLFLSLEPLISFAHLFQI